MSKEGYFDKAD